MGRALQNRKRRSSKSKIRQSNKLKKPLNPRGNSIVARNWDKKETLTQNYRRLGLASRLKAAPGGAEKPISAAASRSRQPYALSRKDPLVIQPLDKAVVSAARVERDADGNIVKIHYADDGQSKRRRKPRDNPLNDPLAEFDSDSEEGDGGDGDDEEEWGGVEEEEEGEKNDHDGRTPVVRMLEEEAARPAIKKPRYQSKREREWVERLVARHGDNVRAMARDRVLNSMQQTEPDIAKRVKKWKETQG